MEYEKTEVILRKLNEVADRVFEGELNDSEVALKQMVIVVGHLDPSYAYRVDHFLCHYRLRNGDTIKASGIRWVKE